VRAQIAVPAGVTVGVGDGLVSVTWNVAAGAASGGLAIVDSVAFGLWLPGIVVFLDFAPDR